MYYYLQPGVYPPSLAVDSYRRPSVVRALWQMHLPPAACMARQFVLAIAEVWWPVQEGQLAVHCPVVVNACLSAKECHQGVVVLQLVVEVGDEYQGGPVAAGHGCGLSAKENSPGHLAECARPPAVLAGGCSHLRKGPFCGAHPRPLAHSRVTGDCTRSADMPLFRHIETASLGHRTPACSGERLTT